MIETTTKLTLKEYLTILQVDLDRSQLMWLAGKVSTRFKELYPDIKPTKVYRPNDRGKFISMGRGYDDRVIAIIEELV